MDEDLEGEEKENFRGKGKIGKEKGFFIFISSFCLSKFGFGLVKLLANFRPFRSLLCRSLSLLLTHLLIF